MARVLDRIRAWLGLEGHTEEHIDVRRELTEQKSRIRALDAYVEARSAKRERRQSYIVPHPQRRAEDRR